MHTKIGLGLLLLLFLSSCFRNRNDDGEFQAYVPVYLTNVTKNEVKPTAVRETKNPGKIYAYQQYLFQVEQREGIHVIDNSNPQQARKIGFIQIPGCTELAVKASFLYTNNINDLVVLDISNATSPTIASRLNGAFPDFDPRFPPNSGFGGTYYECPDETKGLVVGWELKTIKQPKCRR